jgi:hypothetical protein
VDQACSTGLSCVGLRSDERCQCWLWWMYDE